jgi:hypothetical protein
LYLIVGQDVSASGGWSLIFFYRLLRGKNYREAKAKRFDRVNPPQPIRWRPKVKLYGFLTGLVGGLGAVVLVAQYGVAPLTTRALSTRGVAGALLGGLILPSLIFALVVWRFNTRLDRGKGSRRPHHAAAAAGTVGLWLGAALFGAALAGPAGAFVNGPCRATFAGVDAEGLETGSSSYAIDVPENGTVNYTMTAPDGLASWKFVLVYGPYEEVIDEGRAEPPRPGDLGLGLRFRGLVGDATVDESGNTVSGSAVVEDYAWMGAGLYEVQGFVVTKSGATCEGAVLIDVAGNPLTTVLGGAAAAATLVGAIGIAGVTLGGLRDGGELISALDDYGERAEPPPSDDADGAPAAGESGAPPPRSAVETAVVEAAGHAATVVGAAGGAIKSAEAMATYAAGPQPDVPEGNEDNTSKHVQIAAGFVKSVKEHMDKDGMGLVEASALAGAEAVMSNTEQLDLDKALGQKVSPGVSLASGALLPEGIQRVLSPADFGTDLVSTGYKAVRGVAFDDTKALEKLGTALAERDVLDPLKGYSEVGGLLADEWYNADANATVTAGDVVAALPDTLGDIAQDYADKAAAGKFNSALNGLAELAQIAGDFSADPRAAIGQFGKDVGTIMSGGTDLLLDEELWKEMAANTKKALEEAPLVGDLMKLAEAKRQAEQWAVDKATETARWLWGMATGGASGGA